MLYLLNLWANVSQQELGPEFEVKRPIDKKQINVKFTFREKLADRIPQKSYLIGKIQSASGLPKNLEDKIP